MNGLIGKTIGGYQILEQIGEGGMATVYKAYQPSLDRYVAVKILPRHLSLEPGFSKRFKREARAVAKLEHPNILPVHDFGQEEELSYIVMRYIDAGTLKDLMGQPFNLNQISELIGQIAAALEYAHEQGYVHRDVKPSNVLLDRKTWVLLSDFGLAKMMEGSEHITATGVGVGTPAYMSPEQGRGEKVDHRSDVYSLGVVLYEMLTGQVPYQADTPMAVVFKHIYEPLPRPSGINPQIPEILERILLKALAKAPEDRYQSVGELARALKESIQVLESRYVKPVAKDDAQTLLEVRKTDRPQWIGRLRKVWWILPVALVFVIFGIVLIRMPRVTDLLSTTSSSDDEKDSEQESISTAKQFDAIELLIWSNVHQSQIEPVMAMYNVWANMYAPGSTLKIEILQPEEIQERLKVASLLGDSPDLIWMSHDSANSIIADKLVQSVDDIVDLSLYTDTAVASTEFEDQHWGIPFYLADHLMFLYNKSLVERPPTNTDELITFARGFEGSSIQGFIYTLKEPFWMIPWLGGYGGHVFLDNGVTPNLNSRAVADTFQLMLDFKIKYGIVPEECDYNCMHDLFSEGSVAMIINGDWALPHYIEQLGSKLGVARIPDISGVGTPLPYIKSVNLMLPIWLSEERKEAVVSFVKWLTQDKENQLDISLELRRLPALKVALNDPALTGDPILAGSLEQMENSILVPTDPEMSCIWEGLLQTFPGMMEEASTPIEAAIGAQQIARECVANIQH